MATTVKRTNCRVMIQRDPLTFCNGDKKAWQLVCLDHWEQLPKPLQDQVWREYTVRHLHKAAQGSASHMAAIMECYRFLNAPEPCSHAVLGLHGICTSCGDYVGEQVRRATPPTTEETSADAE